MTERLVVDDPAGHAAEQLVKAVADGGHVALAGGSNAWLELAWYMFAGMVMLGASKVLRVNEHVRSHLAGEGPFPFGVAVLRPNGEI